MPGSLEMSEGGKKNVVVAGGRRWETVRERGFLNISQHYRTPNILASLIPLNFKHGLID
jgi:hypothetical protein